MAEAELCTCESESHGELGPVANAERLARLVTSPNHFRKDGRLKPGAFPPSHIKASGLSLMRIDLMAEDFIVEVAQKIAKEGENLKGLLVRTAGDLRSLKDDADDRLLCIVDDPVIGSPPYPDNPAHAIAVSSKERAEDEILEIQSALFELFDGTLIHLGSVHKA